MSCSVKVKIVCALILGVILMFTGLFWYFRVYTKTPNYALKSIETALDTQDVKMFHRYVRLDSILDSGYDEFMAGMMEMDFRHSREDSAAIDDFTKMLKPAFAKMLRDAIDLRLSTGEWTASDSSIGDGETENILLRTGLQDLTLRSIVHLSIDESGRTALADILSHQSEADADFTFKAELIPSENGDWQVVRIQNLYEYAVFLGTARRAHVERYLQETESIIARHNHSVGLAKIRLYSTLTAGALGNQKTRDTARTIMEQDILTDWQTRREELSSVQVPRTMKSLHQLRLKICDLHISYAEGYAAWMTDKNATTIRMAEKSLRQAEVLELEETFLVQRAKQSFADETE